MDNFFIIIDKIKTKIITEYRKKVYYSKMKIKSKVGFVDKVIFLGCNNFKIGNNVVFYPDVSFSGDGDITIGDNAAIGKNVNIYSSKSGGGVTIGDNTMIAANCYIIDTNLGIDKDNLIRNQKNTVSPITIGNDVWIATGCNVIKGAKLMMVL